MADIAKDRERESKPESAPKAAEKKDTRAPEGLRESRGEIAGAIAEGAEGIESAEGVTGAEKVSERVTEAPSEKKPAGAKPAKKKDDDKGDQGDAAGIVFTFDEKNLPPAPKMIRQIEKVLRQEIRGLEREAKRHRAGIFRKGDLNRYSDAVSEIRKKNVLLKRLLIMAVDALKKLYIQIFAPKKTVK